MKLNKDCMFCYVFCYGKQKNLGQVSFDYSCSPCHSGLFLLLVLLRSRNNSTSPFFIHERCRKLELGKAAGRAYCRSFSVKYQQHVNTHILLSESRANVFRGLCFAVDPFLCHKPSSVTDLLSSEM